MSIALATKGRLWPNPGMVIHDHVMDIHGEIDDPLKMNGTIEMQAISGEVSVQVVSATIVVVDDLTGEIVSPGVDGTINNCR